MANAVNKEKKKEKKQIQIRFFTTYIYTYIQNAYINIYIYLHIKAAHIHNTHTSVCVRCSVNKRNEKSNIYRLPICVCVSFYEHQMH